MGSKDFKVKVKQNNFCLLDSDKIEVALLENHKATFFMNNTNLNFNSVETLPHLNAKAAFQVDSLVVFRTRRQTLAKIGYLQDILSTCF